MDIVDSQMRKCIGRQFHAICCCNISFLLLRRLVRKERHDLKFVGSTLGKAGRAILAQAMSAALVWKASGLALVREPAAESRLCS